MYTGSFNTQGCTLRKEDPGTFSTGSHFGWGEMMSFTLIRLEHGWNLVKKRWKYGIWRKEGYGLIFQLSVLCFMLHFYIRWWQFCCVLLTLLSWPVSRRRRPAPSTTITSAPWKHWWPFWPSANWVRNNEYPAIWGWIWWIWDEGHWLLGLLGWTTGFWCTPAVPRKLFLGSWAILGYSWAPASCDSVVRMTYEDPPETSRNLAVGDETKWLFGTIEWD